MSELVRKTGIAGVAVGFGLGFLVDKIVQYAYVNFVPAQQRPSTPIFNLDDWIMIAVGVVAIMAKREEFGFGWLLGVLVGSYFFK